MSIERISEYVIHILDTTAKVKSWRNYRELHVTSKPGEHNAFRFYDAFSDDEGKTWWVFFPFSHAYKMLTSSWALDEGTGKFVHVEATDKEVARFLVHRRRMENLMFNPKRMRWLDMEDVEGRACLRTIPPPQGELENHNGPHLTKEDWERWKRGHVSGHYYSDPEVVAEINKNYEEALRGE